MAGDADAQWEVGDLESGCWWIWPLFFFLFFFIFFIVIIILLMPCRKRRDPCDPPREDTKQLGARAGRGLRSLLAP